MVKALIFAGLGVGQSCLPGTVAALNKYGIEYGTATKINATTLKGYDVLFLPGGNSAKALYITNSDISASAIKAWQNEGGVVIGTCSGAYAASNKVDGYYTAFGLAGNTNCKAYNYEGTTTIKFSSKGESVLKRSGTLSLLHENGPAMYIKDGGSADILATFTTGTYAGYAAIVADGKTGLLGPHPELTPNYPDILINLMNYLLQNDNGDDNVEFKISKITEASSRVAAFIETNKRLPNYVSIDKQYLSMADFLYSMTTTISEINNRRTDNIKYKEIDEAPNPSGSFTVGTKLLKTAYVTVAENIKKYINTNNRAPNYATTDAGKIPFEDLVYNMSLILAFYNSQTRLPNYLTLREVGESTVSGNSIRGLIQKGTGITFTTITEFYNKIILPYAAYSNPMYFDDIKTLKEEVNVIINNVKGNRTGNANQLNCCDFAGLIAALAVEMGYGKAGIDVIHWSFRCTANVCNHAVVLIKTKEFASGSVSLNTTRGINSIKTYAGKIIDGAAGAYSGYAIGNHWCSATNILACKEPAWMKYESL
jgi:glutamine amidotransferase-like uncharacterized protein